MPSGPDSLLFSHNLISFGLPTTNTSTLYHFKYNYFSLYKGDYHSYSLAMLHYPPSYSLTISAPTILPLPFPALVNSHDSQPSSRPDFHWQGTGEGRVRGPFEGARAGQSNSTSRIPHKFFKISGGISSTTSSRIVVVPPRSFDGQLCACAQYKGRSSSGGLGGSRRLKAAPSQARRGLAGSHINPL